MSHEDDDLHVLSGYRKQPWYDFQFGTQMFPACCCNRVIGVLFLKAGQKWSAITATLLSDLEPACLREAVSHRPYYPAHQLLS